ncbi:hypothetical protein QP248_02710 [Aerococcus sp. UMB8608]|uniref:hypothetical protein n=1 Tax=Aerococcus TaxID=1375 RepID=UPI000B2942BC|nr:MULTISPECIES: hypothetical protein [Aerococcus]MDK6679361.1 hypothetical protein [Aerococcus sp. UMB8608]MDK6685797.1 hypothetical protein [Aerococcus sp. UMB8623]
MERQLKEVTREDYEKALHLKSELLIWGQSRALDRAKETIEAFEAQKKPTK